MFCSSFYQRRVNQMFESFLISPKLLLSFTFISSTPTATWQEGGFVDYESSWSFLYVFIGNENEKCARDKILLVKVASDQFALIKILRKKHFFNYSGTRSSSFFHALYLLPTLARMVRNTFHELQRENAMQLTKMYATLSGRIHEFPEYLLVTVSLPRAPWTTLQ